MNPFEFHRPSSLADAVALLRGDDEAKLLGGGQSLLPTMKLDLAAPSALVAVAHLGELKGIRREGNALVVGAGSTHAEVERSEVVRDAIPALAALAAHIGDPQVRNRGTLGGSVAHADPAADYPAAVVALDATVETDRRTVHADAFFTGLFATALEPDEIVKAVHFVVPERAAYAKFPNPASLYAVAGVFVAKHQGGAVRVAVTGAGPTVFRVPAMEQALTARFAPEALDGITVPAEGLNHEPDATREYRAHLIAVMARRAVAAAAS